MNILICASAVCVHKRQLRIFYNYYNELSGIYLHGYVTCSLEVERTRENEGVNQRNRYNYGC